MTFSNFAIFNTERKILKVYIGGVRRQTLYVPKYKPRTQKVLLSILERQHGLDADSLILVFSA